MHVYLHHDPFLKCKFANIHSSYQTSTACRVQMLQLDEDTTLPTSPRVRIICPICLDNVEEVCNLMLLTSSRRNTRSGIKVHQKMCSSDGVFFKAIQQRLSGATSFPLLGAFLSQKIRDNWLGGSDSENRPKIVLNYSSVPIFWGSIPCGFCLYIRY